jgi:anaerobic ribonucleoside-triphosphate reductase
VGDIVAVINNLSAVFSSQLEIYKQLTKLTSSLSADIARTKGNMNGLTGKFEQENNLLAEISKLKEQASDDIEIWIEQKNNANSDEAKKLDDIIKNVQDEIMRFLNAEKILKKQIDFYRTKDGAD